MKNEITLAIIIAVLLVGGFVYVLSKNPAPTNKLILDNNYPKYKEIQNPSGFVNTNGQEVTIGEYIGKKVILLDFMTYSCVNCKRTFPYLNEWYQKYEDDGLIIIGIHTPEFAFEHKIDNVRRALGKEGIKFPVVLDNDYATWRAYGNKFWPRKYLINKDGEIAYDHIGEGAYDEIESKIVEFLGDLNNTSLEKEEGSVTEKSSNDFSRVKTPEIYLGSARVQYINNLSSVDCLTSACNYIVPEVIPLNSFSLDGVWKLEEESAVLEDSAGSIFLRFSASKVHIVASGGSRAEIYLDGELVKSENSGTDVFGGVVVFENEDFYNLVDLGGEYGEHSLEIRVLEPGFQGFAFTFG